MTASLQLRFNITSTVTVVVIVMSLLIGGCRNGSTAESHPFEPIKKLAPWTSGTLDIHFINTGRGDAAFMVFPDATTLLFDVGSVDENVVVRHPPLKLADPKPDASRRPGEWVADYIKRVKQSVRSM